KVAYATNPNHPEIALNYMNLGSSYIHKGDHDKAIIHYHKALEIQKIAYAGNPNHPNIAKNYMSLGVSYVSKGEYDQAIIYCQKSLDIQKVAYVTRPNHPEISLNYMNLGSSYIHKGDDDKAIIHYHKALEIQKIAYAVNPNHPNIAKNYMNLGVSYVSKGEYDKGITYYHKALEIQKIAYVTNPYHPEIALNYMNLGASYMGKEEYDQTIIYCQKALNIQQVAYMTNPNHPNIAKNYINLGASYMKKKEYDQAIIYCQKSLDIQQVAYATNPDHPDIIKNYLILSATYTHNDLHNKALEYAVKSGNEELINACLNLQNTIESESKKNYNDLPQPNTFDDPLKELVFDTRNTIKQAYQQNNLKLAITEQQKLLEIDPEFQYGTHYHNLARFFNCDNQIKEADKVFLKGITNQNVKITSAFYTEYAQFLIVNENYKKLQIDEEAIAQYLYESVYCNNLGGLSYGMLEKHTICPTLQNLIQDPDTSIEVDPKVLAYHLLITNPEYTMEGHNAAEDLLEYASNIDNCDLFPNIVESVLMFSELHQKDSLNEYFTTEISTKPLENNLAIELLAESSEEV
ncbi:MAG: hypothetical protein DGJ47_001157, partial [Rickettsiaceae bacterium]